MQEELRRCNFLGDAASIYALARIAITDDGTDFKSISSICALNPSINVKIKACLSFFTELGFLEYTNGVYSGTNLGQSSISGDLDCFVDSLSRNTLTYLIDNRFIQPEAIIYDYNTGVCSIKRSGIAFAVAVMRNLLIEVGVFIESEPGLFNVSGNYEQLFEERIRNSKASLSLEQLMEIHKKQELQGRLAEEFVVEYERRRLLWCHNADKVKQISDFDVTAGYDILSCNDAYSTSYDRFIEVKSFSSTQAFYWSSNEIKTAREKKDAYYLYLVDIEQFQQKGYEPIIVQNPAERIFNSEDWVVETDTVRVRKV
jgi:CRISPR/Cas system-associated exonuclease Cas4 (RecB family)